MFSGIDHSKQSASVVCPVAGFILDQCKLMASQQLSDVSRLSGLAFVISPPAPTSRADKRNVGEEIGRSVTSEAAPLHFSPADVA